MIGLSVPGVDKVQEREAPLSGKRQEKWENHDIIVNELWREIFSLKLCFWGRKHFVHP